MGQVYKPSTHQLLSNTKSCYDGEPFFLVYGRDPNLPLHQLLEIMQYFMGDPESKRLNVEHYCHSLGIAKKTLDENHFMHAQKTLDRKPSSFQLEDRVYFKNKQPGKWDLKWRPGHKVVCIECDRHYLHIENQDMEKTRSCNVRDIIHEPPIESGTLTLSLAEPGNS